MSLRSNPPSPFTFFDTSKAPRVVGVSKLYGALNGGVTLLVTGTNFAPSDDPATRTHELSCRFTPLADAGIPHPNAPAVR